jgi:hypothetical protein
MSVVGSGTGYCIEIFSSCGVAARAIRHDRAENPEHYQYCGECGAPLPVTCPNGHQNPPHQRYCGECAAPLAANPAAPIGTLGEPPPAAATDAATTEPGGRLKTAPSPQIYPLQESQTGGARHWNQLAIWSLVASLIGGIGAMGTPMNYSGILFALTSIAVVGVVLGIIGVIQTKQNQQRGLGLAIAGSVFGAACVILVIAIYASTH